MLAQLLYSIDVFGLPATLNFAGREKSKSKFGGFCSILFYGFVLWTIINGSKDLFTKVNPKIISSQSNNEEPPGFSISPRGFPLAFQVQTSDDLNFMTYIDESIYTINVYYSRAFRITKENGMVETVWNDTKLVLERCTPDHMGPDLKQVYAEIFELPMQCIASYQPELDEEIRISGTYNSMIWRRLLIELAPCNNATSSVTCAPKEKIEKIISGGWLDILYNNMLVNPNNYTHPNGAFQDYYYTMLSLSNYYETYIDLGRVEVDTDAGWLLEEIEAKAYPNVVKISESMLGKPHPRGILAGVTIEMGKLENFYVRRYKKIQDVLAEVAGFTNVALLVLLVLTTPYLRLKFRESLMNELFDVKIGNKEDYIKRTASFGKKKQSIYTINEDKSQSNLCQNEGSEYMNSSIPNSIKKLHTLKSLKPSNFYAEKSYRESESIDQIMKNSIPTVTSKSFEKPSNPSGIKKVLRSRKSSGTIRRHSVTKTTGLESSCSLNKIIDPSNKENQQPSKSYGVLPSIQETSCIDVTISKKKAIQPSAKVLRESEDERPGSSGSDSEGYDLEEKETPKQNEEDLEMQTTTIKREMFHEVEKNLREINEEKEEKIKQSLIKRFFWHRFSKPKEANNKEKKLDISIWEYMFSFFYKTKVMKQKIKVLNEGVKQVDARLDIRYILRNIRELEKLSALLFDHDQLLLFEHLPKAQLEAEEANTNNNPESERQFKHFILRKHCMRPEKPVEQQVKEAYSRIKGKKHKTKIDLKLLEVFDEGSVS